MYRQTQLLIFETVLLEEGFWVPDEAVEYFHGTSDSIWFCGTGIPEVGVEDPELWKRG